MADPKKYTNTRVSRGTKGMTITTRSGGKETTRKVPYTKQNDPMVAFRAGERASANKSPQARTAGPVTKKLKNTPKGGGATVGDALNAIGKAVGDGAWAANNVISAGMKSSPGLKSKGIQNVMKLPAKRK